MHELIAVLIILYKYTSSKGWWERNSYDRCITHPSYLGSVAMVLGCDAGLSSATKFYIIQVKYCRTRTPSPGLSQPIIQVCNGDKLNFSNLQKLFDLACFLALPECLKIVTCSVSVEFSIGNDQENSLSVVIAGLQRGLFNALATKPTIDEKCGIAIWGINIPRSTPFEDLIVHEFVTANEISHLNRLVLSACSIRSHSIANLSVVVRI